jgi:hypothetical protein
MAPEFFPFIGFGVLVLVVVAGLAIAVVLFTMALYLRWRGGARWARRLVGALSCASLAGILFVSAGLVFLGGKIRQQYFLNEPFVTACADGDLAKAQGLLARGASPDAYGIDFVDTALSAAAASGHREIVDLLLRSGAHVDQKDSHGKTAAERARENRHDEIAQMIEASKNNHPKT